MNSFVQKTKLSLVCILILAASTPAHANNDTSRKCDFEDKSVSAPCTLKDQEAIENLASMNFNNSKGIEEMKTKLLSRVSQFAVEVTALKIISPSVGPVPSVLKYEVLILSDSKLSEPKRLKGHTYLWTVTETEHYDWNYFTYTNTLVEVSEECIEKESNAESMACARASAAAKSLNDLH